MAQDKKVTQTKAKVLIIGGGPGGYVAAEKCGQLGLDTILVEADRLGGTCLTRGCIPSKALIHAASRFEAITAAATTGQFGITVDAKPKLNFMETVDWKDGIVGKLESGVAGLMKRAKVRVINGWATFSDAKTCSIETAEGTVVVSAEHVILANGSQPVELPFLPFGGIVISSTEALSLPDIPKRLVIVGAGYIGLELGIAFRKLGSEVTIVEAQDRILPLYDSALVTPVRRWLDRHDVTLHLGVKARGLGVDGRSLEIETTNHETITLAADRILVTVGRKPVTDGWGLENMALTMDGRFIKVDDRCATSSRNVWAIGDLVGEPMLAHKASAQAAIVAEIIAGKKRRFDPVAIPAVCFTEPEIVSVGLSPDDAKAAGIPATTQSFPFQANGRALTMAAGDDGGFVRVVSREDGRIIGIQAVGQHVSELSGEFAHAMEMGSVLADVAGTIHVHPTLSEAFHEAALKSMPHG